MTNLPEIKSLLVNLIASISPDMKHLYENIEYQEMMIKLGTNETFLEQAFDECKGQYLALVPHLHFAWFSAQMNQYNIGSTQIPRDEAGFMSVDQDVQKWNKLAYDVLMSHCSKDAPKHRADHTVVMKKWLENHGYLMPTYAPMLSTLSVLKGPLAIRTQEEIKGLDKVGKTYFEIKNALLRMLEELEQRAKVLDFGEALIKINACRELLSEDNLDYKAITKCAESIECVMDDKYSWNNDDKRILLGVHLGLIALASVGIVLFALTGPVGWVGITSLVFMGVGLFIPFIIGHLTEKLDIMPALVETTQSFAKAGPTFFNNKISVNTAVDAGLLKEEDLTSASSSTSP